MQCHHNLCVISSISSYLHPDANCGGGGAGGGEGGGDVMVLDRKKMKIFLHMCVLI